MLFRSLLLDIRYGNSVEHPYWGKMDGERRIIARNFDGWYVNRTLPEMLYVFMVHRLTGSGINYAESNSGYCNTALPEFYMAETIEQMVEVFISSTLKKYTSVGYQFPAFPKPIGKFTRGGDYFIAAYVPTLVRELAEWLVVGGKKDLREVGNWMFDWNKRHGLRAYRFQYAAFIADIADFFPQYVNTYSPFYYGSNAVECISYMATPMKKMNEELFLDAIMNRAERDTGFAAYDLEDQMCDCIRWIENYVRPGGIYDSVDRDNVWSSSRIVDHPFGRQRNMLKLGLIESFNTINRHPSGNYVIKQAGLTVDEYKSRVKGELA